VRRVLLVAVVALADGGDHSDWHDRRDGKWGSTTCFAGEEQNALSQPVWIDVGRSDPFMNADTTLAAELRAHGTRVQLVVHGGGHSGWTGRPRYLRFDAGACAA
jgi:dienelactone hydrolase